MIMGKTESTLFSKYPYSLFLALLIVFLVLLRPALAGELELKQHGATLEYPDSWVATTHPSNTVLMRQASGADGVTAGSPVAEANAPQMIISTETRLDHEGAVSRLLDIGGVRGASWEYLEIGGWPALQQKYLRDRPRGSKAKVGGSEMILVVQTVVANGATLIRMETWLTPDASDSEIAEVESIGRSLITPTRGDAAQVAKEIDDLRNGKAPRGAVPQPPRSVSATVPRVSTSALPSSGLTPIEEVGGLDGGFSVPVSNQGGRDAELEIAVSPNGRDIVIGSNLWWYFSSDGGQTWNLSQQGGNPFTGNDPSVAWGQSGGAQGTFYGANIAAPSTGIITSIDGGATWQAAPPAYTCSQNGDTACPSNPPLPDQEHIASDRLNLTAGGDQVYSAWRHLDGNYGIVCTQDSGANWSNNAFFRAGDLPKPGVGADGFVYVIYLNGGNIMLDKYAPCEVQTNPMTPVAGFPVVVRANAAPVACPTPGLDRCNRRNTLSGITVAVDDTDSNHIYVTYAINTFPSPGGAIFEGSPVCGDQNLCNEDIVVQDSLDGGATWLGAYPGDSCIVGVCLPSGTKFCGSNLDCFDPDRTTTISSGVTARRFMPWLCTIGGAAHVSWYDRRAAFPGGGAESSNSLTDFYAGSASLDPLGNLQSDGEFQVNDPGTDDAQCEAGFVTGSTGSWPSAVDRGFDSESCSQQPQLGGFCQDRICVGGFCADGSGTACAVNTDCSNTRCDFSGCGGVGNNNGLATCACGAGFTCDINRGSPKYGDYNGNACAAGRLYMTWASAEAPLASPPATDIDSVFSSEVVCCVPQIQVPGNVDFGDACGMDEQKETLNVCNTGKENLVVSAINGELDGQYAVTTPLAGWPITISPDFCFPFEVTFNPDGTGDDSETLTIINNDPVNPALEVTVEGSVGVADINTFIADSGDFGEVCKGLFHDLNLTVQNDGTCPLEIDSVSLSGANPGDFELPDGSLAGTIIEAGNSLLIPVRFAPNVFGDPDPRTASVDIESSTQGGDSLSEDNTPVQGTVPPPDINVAIADSGEFPDVCKGDQADLDLTLFNQGRCDLTITSIVSSNALFVLPEDTTYPLVLSHDADFPYPVRYAPVVCNDAGDVGTITINSDSPGENSLVVDVSGVSPCPNLVIDPGALTGAFAFPATVVDDTGTLGCYAERSTNIRNTGACPLTITDISAAGADFTVMEPTTFPPIVLPPGEETLSVTVRFTPEDDGMHLTADEITGVLTVVSDDPDAVADGDDTADLCGEGVIQSGIRVLVTDITSGDPVIVDSVDSMVVKSKGKSIPGPINLQFTDVEPVTTSVCDNTVSYHLNVESLPATDTTGSQGGKSQYQASAMEGNLQDQHNFTLDQCEFSEFQLELKSDDGGDGGICLLLPKGESCSADHECCSFKCKGPSGGKTCK